MKENFFKKVLSIIFILLFFTGCQTKLENGAEKSKRIVVTYSVLGSVVKELVGDQIEVVVLIPDGKDPHEWEPSAKDVETLIHADLIVQNGLGLEGGMEKALAQAKEADVKFFSASDHIQIRHVGMGEGIPSDDPDQAAGALDPHLWMDPVGMKEISNALSAQLMNDLGINVSERAVGLNKKLDGLNEEIIGLVNTIPVNNRKFVTGHESMGYFAQRYGFKLVGAIIPSITSQAEVSAADMAALKKLIKDNQVKAVFTELGTPAAVSDTIGKETGIKVLSLTTHQLPEDGSYISFLRNLAKTIVDGLK